jgi:hypothetical protein
VAAPSPSGQASDSRGIDHGQPAVGERAQIDGLILILTVYQSSEFVSQPRAIPIINLDRMCGISLAAHDHLLERWLFLLGKKRTSAILSCLLL